MSWTPERFAEDTDHHYAHAQSYESLRSPDVNSDLQNALRAVASAQDAAREVIKALARHPELLDANELILAENYLLSVEASTRKLRAGFDFLKPS
ncbi:hypothetical protein [Baekduia sp. Peel2402]|uniref:hypothetical protein n=1 Tax=Baekduia sp. Peel2402 TaxID=3458296 RepID=UPI00403E373C